MAGLLFVLGFAVLLGVAQLLGLTVDSRDSHDWHNPDPPGHHILPDPPDAEIISLDEYRHHGSAA